MWIYIVWSINRILMYTSIVEYDHTMPRHVWSVGCRWTILFFLNVEFEIIRDTGVAGFCVNVAKITYNNKYKKYKNV